MLIDLLVIYEKVYEQSECAQAAEARACTVFMLRMLEQECGGRKAVGRWQVSSRSKVLSLSEKWLKEGCQLFSMMDDDSGVCVCALHACCKGGMCMFYR